MLKLAVSYSVECTLQRAEPWALAGIRFDGFALDQFCYLWPVAHAKSEMLSGMTNSAFWLRQ